jgi:hypothetical protein
MSDQTRKSLPGQQLPGVVLLLPHHADLDGSLLAFALGLPVSMKRVIALLPATLVLTSENSSDFHVDFPLVASAINSAFV